jgi:imidazolonepropionase-like amidohydrolase
MSISLIATLFLSHIICEIVDESEEFTKKNKIMNTILIGVPSLFIISFYILSLLEITSDADIWAVNFKALDNKSLSSLNTGNGNETLVLDGATLIDGNGGPQKADSVLVIDDSKRIVAITNQTNFRDNSTLNNDSNGSQSNERVLNLTGKYIIPGLFDMHAHIAGVRKNSYDHAMSKNMLGMLLDYGVTTVRNPGGPTNETVRLRGEVLNGTISGPEVFTAGRLLNTPEFPVPFVEKKLTTEEGVMEEVRHQAAAGVDYIKLYVGLKPDLVKAAIDEAQRQGIKVIGHLYLTSWTDAANLGIDFLTHGVPVSPFLLPEDKQRIFNRTGGGPFDHSLWLDLVDLNSAEIKNMIESLVQNHIPVDPTLSVYEAIFVRQGFADPQNEQRWNKVLRLTKMMHDSGVKILSGTDIPNFELVPGESLHHELELLVEAGINTSDVMKIATKNGAEALDLMNQTGTIELGKQADILILSANPIEAIENTKRIYAVISNGRIIERSN